jgi:sensor histidine kinase YesM
LLRRAIRSDDAVRVPLGRELGFVRRYVALQRARYGPRLRVRLDVPREARACLVPPQILQPLVENAILHGGPGAGHPGAIEIVGRITDDRLEIAVSDRGPGPSRLPVREGTGLRSTRARLDAACADAYTLHLTGRPDGGAICRIEMPCLS